MKAWDICYFHPANISPVFTVSDFSFPLPCLGGEMQDTGLVIQQLGNSHDATLVSQACFGKPEAELRRDQSLLSEGSSLYQDPSEHCFSVPLFCPFLKHWITSCLAVVSILIFSLMITWVMLFSTIYHQF